MDVEDAYRILDLEVGATQSEVNESWKLLAQIWHPDKHTKSSEKIKHKASLKYAEVDKDDLLDEFDKDLSTLGEALELRFELEDELIDNLYSNHTS